MTNTDDIKSELSKGHLYRLRMNLVACLCDLDVHCGPGKYDLFIAKTELEHVINLIEIEIEHEESVE